MESMSENGKTYTLLAIFGIMFTAFIVWEFGISPFFMDKQLLLEKESIISRECIITEPGENFHIEYKGSYIIQEDMLCCVVPGIKDDKLIKNHKYVQDHAFIFCSTPKPLGVNVSISTDQ